MTARFITIEGLEGAGKSTQLSVLANWVTDHHGSPLVTREPGGTPLAEQIRDLVLGHHTETMDAWTELLLVFAARRQHVTEKIRPALAQSQWVVSDRFTDATYAYQGGGRGIDWARIEALESLVLEGFQPDLTLWLDCPADIGLARARQRGELDRIEQENIDFFERCRAAYERRHREHPDRVIRLDAAQSIEAVSADLVAVLEERCA
ncbi:dTMP kinase [Saccharospirillum salsuginis]|uniref:Thymidylate kinase n=1 Tax=Saccharospirillum salsuginis TaxID=418750 RepID=A0A918K7S2_9GAMM|nr:dTMP kinase [Saccharospirillum salsuginis]GGX51906.1 thymidylate kinase [Saccharospirillum salsuginis]